MVLTWWVSITFQYHTKKVAALVEGDGIFSVITKAGFYWFRLAWRRRERQKTREGPSLRVETPDHHIDSHTQARLVPRFLTNF
jgi:hypothetical protein